MPPSQSGASPYKPLVILGSAVLIITALYFGQKILIPIALAILLAFILSPAVHALQRRGLGRVLSVLLIVIFAFIVLGGIGAVISLELKSLASDLTRQKEIKDQIARKLSSLLGAGQGTFLANIEDSIREIAGEVLKDQGKGEGQANQVVPVRIEPATDYRRYFSQLWEALEPAAEVLATAGLVIVLVIFILIRREDLRNRLVRLTGHGRLIVTTRALDEAATRISRFLTMQVTINVGVGVVICIGLFLIGVPYALLWGFLVAATRFVPYVGVWVAAALMIGFTVAVSPGWSEPLLVLGLLLVIELVTANAVEPLLFGHSTGISSVALLVAAAFWTWLWGPMGLLLSTPLTACLVVLGKYVPQLEFFSILLGDEPALEAQVTYYQRLLARDQDEATELVEAYLQTHPMESIYDELLIPALVLAKRDRERGALDPEDEEFILQVTRDLLNDLILPQRDVHVLATKGVPEPGRPKVLLFGCPAHDAEDELAVQMLRQLVEPAHCRVEVLSARMLSGELVSRIEKEQPALICIGSLPPGGISQTRYLCKRLRHQFPDLKIAVGCWGYTEDTERLNERLRAAGADRVALTLLRTRDQVVPLVQTLAHAEGSAANLQPAATPA